MWYGTQLTLDVFYNLFVMFFTVHLFMFLLQTMKTINASWELKGDSVRVKQRQKKLELLQLEKNLEKAQDAN